MSFYGSALRTADPNRTLSSDDVTLEVRQHPQHALVTPEHKEKMRKPIDPPPIVQLKVHSDKQQNWLVNPFLFMNAVLVSHEDDRAKSQPKSLTGNQLLGQNVSSLHRLKDVNNRDGGFFVFGDISCRRTGTYRLQFNLFNYEKEEVNFVSSALSRPFRVMTSKDYPGLQESTHLSRAFSDQGVRLRLRKEQRNGGSKRTYTAATSDASETNNQRASYGGPVTDNNYTQDRTFVKRQRSDSEYTSPHAYPASQYNNSVSPYGMPSAGSNSWTQQQHGAQQESYMAHAQPTQQPAMSWGRSHGPYAAASGGSMSAGSYFPGSMATNPVRGIDYSQQSSQYSARSMNDSSFGLSTMSTPISEPSVGSAHSSIPPMGIQSHVGQYGNALPNRTQQYDMSSSVQPYQSAAAAFSQSLQQNYPPGSSSLSYEQQNAAPTIKSEEAAYNTSSNNLYNTSPHSTYPGTDQTFSSSNLPLSTGLLNREFTGGYPPQAQEPEYGDADASAQDLSGYSKSQSAAYPTPQQTSPAQLQDHG